MTRDLVQTAAFHIPIIISTTLMCKKQPHGGSTLGRCYIREQSKYTREHFRRRFRMNVELFFFF
ncbi:hypothetical protein ACOSQ3_032982 [Xanthoceras sorbifolium]